MFYSKITTVIYLVRITTVIYLIAAPQGGFIAPHA